MYIRKRDSSGLVELVVSQYFQFFVFSREVQGQYIQIFKDKLEEVVTFFRDEKIVVLVLVRFKKVQRMRELQQQAVLVWEELKRSDQKVQMILERERKLLFQQGREQWQSEKERRKIRQSREQRVRRQDSYAKNTIQQENRCKAFLDDQENSRREKLETVRVVVEYRKQCQVQRLQEQERVL